MLFGGEGRKGLQWNYRLRVFISGTLGFVARVLHSDDCRLVSANHVIVEP